jgi:translation initiation factor IF-1
MVRPDAFSVEGIVKEVMPNGLCWVELSNGHRLAAWGTERAGLTAVEPGQTLIVKVSPCDLSHGRVLKRKES